MSIGGNRLREKLAAAKSNMQALTTQTQKAIQETKPKKTEVSGSSGSSGTSSRQIRTKSYATTGNLGLSRRLQRKTEEEFSIDASNAALQLFGDLNLIRSGSTDIGSSGFIRVINRNPKRVYDLFKGVVTSFNDGIFPKFKGVYTNYIGGYSRTSSDSSTTTFRYSQEITQILKDTETLLADKHFDYVVEDRNKEEDLLGALQNYINIYEEKSKTLGDNIVEEFMKNKILCVPYKMVSNQKIYINDEILKGSFKNLVSTTFNVSLVESIEVGGYKEFYLPIDILENTLNSVLGPYNWATYTSSVFRLPRPLKEITKNDLEQIVRVTTIPASEKDKIYLCRCIYIDLLGNCTYAQVETIPNFGNDENGIVTIKSLAKRAAITRTFPALQSIKGPKPGEEASGQQMQVIDLIDGFISTARNIGRHDEKGKFVGDVFNHAVNFGIKDITKRIPERENQMIMEGPNKSKINKILQIEDAKNEISIDSLKERIIEKIAERREVQNEGRQPTLVSTTKQPMILEESSNPDSVSVSKAQQAAIENQMEEEKEK